MSQQCGVEQKLLVHRRPFTQDDLPLVEAVVREDWDRGRTFISQRLCQLWGWTYRNGALADMACRGLLLRLERQGFLKLPPPKNRINNTNPKPRTELPKEPLAPLRGRVSEFGKVRLELVRGTRLEPLWNGFVERYHPEGFRRVVGGGLKYLAFLNERPVACLAWGAAAWSVECRDRYIGWSKGHREQCLHYLANNVRFLILPDVRVRDLASHLLSQAARRLSEDWPRVYGHRLYLLETFVDGRQFRGTCYRAANWKLVGQTKGYGRSGKPSPPDRPLRDVYVFPLVKNFREFLVGPARWDSSLDRASDPRSAHD